MIPKRKQIAAKNKRDPCSNSKRDRYYFIKLCIF